MADNDTSFDAIFCGAIEIGSGAERAAFLARACGSDDELRHRVERLVNAHLQAGSFLESPPTSATLSVTSAPSTEVTGTVIGPYKLLQSIGEGGMGTVYMAEQTHPVRRTVALKLIKAGMDSRQVLARFGAERQALALMDHPNIAKVLDAGTTSPPCEGGVGGGSVERTGVPSASPLSHGRPYFVMELVKGIPITKFCDERRLTLRERLELAIPVCQAVQHAHQKGIIHRDLKPSNVLIALYDGKPVPKIIDFGVAKATGPQLTDQTLYTEFGAVVGTLEYMSPEQAELNQLDIDTRSDIYSLGVLLYELLTGSTPLEHKRIKQGVFLELLRVIREEESPRPSLRLSTTEELPSIAACRHIEPRKLSGLVRGELDWIVMKALEKDRNRRYETANGLAADLRRYLDDEPVQACPPSTLYRFRKFGRRNLGALTTVALVAAALVVGTAVSTWQAIRATQARKEAAQQRDLARANFHKAHQAVDTYLTEVSEDQLLDQPGLQPLRSKLLKSALQYYQAFVEERGADLSLQRELAEAYRRVGSITSEIGSKAEAEAPLQQAIGLFQMLLEQTPDDEELQSSLARSYQTLAYAQTYGNQAARAKESAERAVTLLVILRADHRQVTEYGRWLGQNDDMIGVSLVETGQYAAAKPFHMQAVEVLSETSRQAPDDAKVKLVFDSIHSDLLLV